MGIKKIISVFLTIILCFSVNIPASATNIEKYRDVPTSHWAYDAIMEMTSREMFFGTSPTENGVGTFSPDATMTRAELISVLTRYLFANELSSMPSSRVWYANNYALALKHGLLSSEELDNGNLEKICTRQEMAMLLIRATYIANGEVAVNLLPTAQIADYDSVASKYQSYVLQSFSLGLITGVDAKGTFNPYGYLNRAQAATVIYRLIDPSTRKVLSRDNNISFTWKDGITYNGEYLNGEANGFGTMIFPGVGTYTGYFVNGKREGIGTFKWNVGDEYVGMWNGDKMHGNGVYTFSDGYTIRGIWKNNEIAADAIYMEPSTLNLEVGSEFRILARCTPEHITEFITWKSSNSSIVSVEGESNVAVLIAKATGKAIIEATTDSGESTTCVVTVKNPSITNISLNYGDYDIDVGDTFYLEANVYPSSASNSNIKWSSSDNDIANVSTNGRVTAKTEGTAIIFAETENGLLATCYVQVADDRNALWNGSWSVYRSNSNGNKTTIYSCGTCAVDIYDETAVLSFDSFSNQEIDVLLLNDCTLEGSYIDGNCVYELMLESINERKIILEMNTIWSSTYTTDTASTKYYVLER